MTLVKREKAFLFVSVKCSFLPSTLKSEIPSVKMNFECHKEST